MSVMHPPLDPEPIPLLDLHAQYLSIKREVDEAIGRVIERSDFILGRELDLFESEFATYCGVKCCVGVGSGLSALELVLRAWGIGAGDEVITAANTFIATALAISSTGATPILVDVDPHTLNIDPDAMRSAITSRTRAVVPVHLYGKPAEMDTINEIAAQYDVAVLEDACQAHGARYKGGRAGSLGHAAAFSFYPGKNLGAYGDGGAIVTNDEALARQLRTMRNYGQREKYIHGIRGSNRRLDTLQAAILRVKLRHLDEWNNSRSQHANEYRELLFGTSVLLPQVAEHMQSAWHLYVIRSPFRNDIRTRLSDQGIATGMHYPVPIHLQAAYADAGYRRGDFPITERMTDEVLSLPMYAELTYPSMERIAAAIIGTPGITRNPVSLPVPTYLPPRAVYDAQ